MRPLLYFSYGMTKTGSTLAFQLVRTALELCGFPQDVVENGAVRPGLKHNFVNHVTEAQLQGLLDEARARRAPIAIKTHARPEPWLQEAVRSGLAKAHACYRDPRDMALSMLDQGAFARRHGRKAFSELHTLEQALENIRQQSETLTQWLRLPGVLPLYYEDIAFDTARTAKAILGQLSLKLDPLVLADIVHTQRFTQKNKARRQRYLSEMDPARAAAIAAEFAPFFEHLIDNRHHLPRSGPPLPAPLSLLEKGGAHLDIPGKTSDLA